MKLLKSILILTLMGIVLLSCKESDKSEPKVVVDTIKSEELAVNLKKVSLDIEGMTCEIGCARTIQAKLSKTEGVKLAKVNFEAKKGIVEFDANKISERKIISIVQGIAGGDLYKVTDTKHIEITSEE